MLLPLMLLRLLQQGKRERGESEGWKGVVGWVEFVWVVCVRRQEARVEERGRRSAAFGCTPLRAKRKRRRRKTHRSGLRNEADGGLIVG